MNKKLQVFVSSTYTDLIEERQAAVEAILDAGHIPAGMELFKAGKSQMKTICKWIDESDVYMLILGGRYGSIEDESGLSYTQLEYEYALSKNMPVFAIVLDDSFLFTKAASQGKDVVFEKDNINKYEVFKENVKSKIVKFVNNTDQINTIIHSQLNYFMGDLDYNLTGWTRISTTPTVLKNLPTTELINSTEIRVATLLNFFPDMEIKDTIKQVCDSIYGKSVQIRHLEEMSYSDQQIMISYSDIIIFDISNFNDGVAFLLGYIIALKKKIIFLCEYYSISLSRIQNYYSYDGNVIIYTEYLSSETIYSLKPFLNKFIY